MTREQALIGIRQNGKFLSERGIVVYIEEVRKNSVHLCIKSDKVSCGKYFERLCCFTQFVQGLMFMSNYSHWFLSR
uniref:Uncharacterized protein n=1 Tax=viral metagenome TaxID=1070528 RepID=A0A6M3IL34_9ZZZZ